MMTDYGTVEYLEWYEDEKRGTIALLKLMTGEMVMGYIDVQDHVYHVDFPMEVVRIADYNRFGIREFVPSLEYRTMQINKSACVTRPMTVDADNVDAYVQCVRETLFPNDGEEFNPMKFEADPTVIH